MSQEITGLLLAWNEGDQEALDRLMPLVHDELHLLAHRYMAGERLGHPLQTTALVNEAYLRLIDSSRVRWQNRAHFFAVSAQLMRRILVDVARARKKLKRGGEAIQVSLDEVRHGRVREKRGVGGELPYRRDPPSGFGGRRNVAGVGCRQHGNHLPRR